ncbi:MAG: ERF family protein [Aureibaculum sp.]|nr:ERF family protein [Aureibaculum sp.]
MKTVIKSLAAARQIIRETKIVKLGFNSFSKYKYFTPDQIHQLCSDACKEVNILTQFNLKRNDLGVTGELIVIDIESAETMTFEMASAIPEIKATNIAQQLGGAVTYTHRYLLMTAFDITDNSLDFDADKKPEKKAKANFTPTPGVKPKAVAPVKKILLTPSHKYWNYTVQKLSSCEITIEDVKEKYSIIAPDEEKLMEQAMNYTPETDEKK